MSAIFGIFYRDVRPVNPEELARMRAVLAHRGPDGAGVWHDGPAGLGHLMLRTTPESLNEHLPLLSRDGRLALTADARIDNRDELIAALNLRDRPAAQISDSELILAAYERWGERCVEHLLGDFAFAVWDRREQKLFCARDHMGVKPFYYYCADRVFAFASEIKGVLALPQVPKQIDELRIAYYLEDIFEDKVRTFYSDIRHLPAAHSCIINRHAMRTARYWTLDATYELRLASDEEYAEAFRDIFTEAVRCRLRSAFPIGCTLSGGLDSSSVVCTARDVLAADGRQPLHTFSAIFPGLPERELRQIDERRYIEAVLNSGVFTAHYLHGDQISPLLAVDRILWHLDMPITAPNTYINWEICRMAEQQHVRIMLDGCEGDITVSHGFERLVELLWQLRWKILHREVTALSQRLMSGYTSRRILWEYGIRPLVPEPVTRLYRNALRRLQARGTDMDSGILNPAFARRIALTDHLRTLRKQAFKPFPSAREIHQQDLDSAVLSKVSEVTDKITAAFGLEIRHPFYDKRLVEFCLAIPADQKLHDGWTRSIMRRGMNGVLPADVQWRRYKSTFSPNLWRKFREYEQSKIEEIVYAPPEYLEQYVDLSALRRCCQRYIAGSAYAGDGVTVYQSIILSLWLQHARHDVVRFSEVKEVHIG